MEVSARKADKPAVTVNVPILDAKDLDELVEAVGADTVFDSAMGALVIDVQAFIRRLMEKGLTNDKIQEEVNNWRPGTRSSVRLSPKEKAKNFLRSLSPEERAQLLAELQAGR